ncbi:hypothetical protein F5B21DRAFT_526525 [Xylaria acuta]|nr:hypothetical protein F5B21DRAFT_526525 [Xylaria acuta]
MEAFEFGRACAIITAHMSEAGMDAAKQWRLWFPRLIKHEIEQAEEIYPILGLRGITAVQQSICNRVWNFFFTNKPVPWTEVTADGPSFGREEEMEISLMKEALKVSITDTRAALAIFARNSADASRSGSKEPVSEVKSTAGNVKVATPAASKVPSPPKPDSTPADSEPADRVSEPANAPIVPATPAPKPEDWKSDETSKGYVRLMGGGLPEMMVIRRLRYQRPWHSKIRLPIEADAGKGTDFYHFECHDLDCLLVVLRMLLSMNYSPAPEYATTAIMTCANHDFGWDRPADYLAKGTLAQKLFPEELKDTTVIDNIDVLLPKMTFENLLKHPGIGKVIFSSPLFLLQSPQMLVIKPSPGDLLDLESSQLTRAVDMTDVCQVNWDGTKTLSEAVSEQAHYVDYTAENGTRVRRRYCLEPYLVRVMFTPDKDHRWSFDDLLRFTLRAPTTERHGRKLREIMSNTVYLLKIVVKMDPKNPIENPAEVRLYDNNAVMMLADPYSYNEYRSVGEHKNRSDSGWRLGDPDFKFMLFYRVWEGDEYPTPLVPPMEYRPPWPVYDFQMPQPPRYDDSNGAEDSQDEI